MKKYLIALAALVILAAPAMASKYGKTVSVTVSTTNGGDFRAEQTCWPMIGNWINAATTHCPSRGYGPPANTRSVTVTLRAPCHNKEYQE